MRSVKPVSAMAAELANTSSSSFVSTCSSSDSESHSTTDTGSTSTQVKNSWPGCKPRNALS